MFVLNTTFHIHKSVESSVLEWMKEKFIGSACDDAAFASAGVMRLMLEVQEDCSSYAVALRSPSIDAALEWHDTKGSCLLKELSEKYGEKAVFFTTCMEELNL